MLDVEAVSDLQLPDGRPLGVANLSTVATGDIANNREVRQLATQLGQWVETARQRDGDRPGMFNRSLYQVPESPYDQMRVARTAVATDDVVAGLADATEAVAFDGGLKWESTDPDEADVFNQLSADLNLDGKIREMWREQFTVDQFVCAKLWDKVSYTVRGETENGNKKKKKITFYAPSRLVMLRPENVVPTGFGPLREDTLAWQATINEIGQFGNVVNGDQLDPLMSAFFTGQYTPGVMEAAEMQHWGVNIERLLSMNPQWVFRHTSTRPDWQKFPDIRIKGIFALLDLKRQLIASDRAMLIGAANYILLIRKGSKDQPATQDEVTNLKANYNFLAKLPVIISDNRLEIDIIAPKLDFVLKKDAYDNLDARMMTRLLATFTSTVKVNAQGADSFNDVIVAGISSKRHMIRRTLEQEIGRAIVDHPRNAGVFQNRPSLVFTPRNVQLGTNQAVIAALLSLRTQREISRDTILEYFGLDEATEAQRLQIEEQQYDDIFKTQIPFSSPAAGGAPATGAPATAKPAPGTTTTTTTVTKPSAKKSVTTPNGTPEDPGSSGRRGGGRPVGGGSSNQSPQAQNKPRTKNGNVSTNRTKADDEDE